MNILFLILVVGVAILVAWRKKWVRVDMVAGSVLALPFLIIYPLVRGEFHTTLTASAIGGFLVQILWVAVLGALAGALYALFIHRHIHAGPPARRALLAWLGLVPLLVVIVQLTTGESFFFSASVGIAVALALVIALQRSLVFDALLAMVGMAAFYLLVYVFFTQVLGVSTGSGGIIFLGYPLEDLLSVLAFGALWGPPFAASQSLNRGESPLIVPGRQGANRLVILAGSFLVIAVGFAWLGTQFVRVPRVIASSPAAEEVIDTLVTPITIQLDRPLDRTKVAVTITPPVEGDLSFEDPYIQRTFMRKIIFTPETYFQPNTTYTVTVSSLKNILGKREGDYSYTFTTPSLPTVVSLTPPPEQKDVAICEPLTVTMDQEVTALTEINFQLEPRAEFTPALSEDKKSFQIKPEACLSQSQTYILTVLRRLHVTNSDGLIISTEEPVAIGSTTFTTKGAPGITAVAPQGGGVLTSTSEVVITFTEAMEAADLASFITLTPAPAGSWSWRDSKTAVYTFSAPLPFSTAITIAMKEGMKDEKGGFLPSAASFTFTTIGAVRVSSVTPYGGSGGIKVGTPIRVTFDQPVDHASAEAHFSLTPAVEGSFSWQGQTMIYSGTLAKDTAYRITVATGVKSLIGLDLASTFSNSFQTETSSVLLNIPVYYQQHQLSCEIAALKMGLSYKGVSVSEDHLLSQIPKYAAGRDGNTWGDPDQEFVGDVNGRQNSSGYGVHAGPILKLASTYRTAQSTSGWTVQNLAQSLASGNPVVIWGTLGSAREDSWTTPAGRQINTWVGEHARTAIGFTGTVDNPITFIINDPIQGRIHWSTAQLKANWATFGNMGVAIE